MTMTRYMEGKKTCQGAESLRPSLDDRMEEIRQLQQQLATAQLEDTSHKLSDRNAIDLLLKIQSLKLIDLIYTSNAKDFLTPKQLELELEDELLSNSGRVEISEIQPTLNVDLSYIEKAAQDISKRGGTVFLNGELITSWYFDSIMEEANELLAKQGQIKVGELAQRFGFSVDFMQDVVERRLNSILHAKLRGTDLYTEAFVQQQIVRIRGAFSAVTKPVLLPEMAKIYKFDDAVLEEILTTLICAKSLSGCIKGREYIPFVFLEMQKEGIYSFFQQNGYLDHSRAMKMDVHRPYEFLKKRFPDCINLTKVVVSSQILSNLEGHLEGVIADKTFLDVTSLLPEAIGKVDAALLVSKCSSFKKDIVQIGDIFVVSSAFILECLEKFTQHSKEYAVEASKVSSSNKKIRKSSPIIHSDDDQETDRQHGKGKKASKASKKKGKQLAEKVVEDDMKEDQILPLNDAVQLLLEWFPLLDGFDNLAYALVSQLYAKISIIYNKALDEVLSSIHRGDALKKQQSREQFEKEYCSKGTNILLYKNALEQLRQRLSDQNTNQQIYEVFQNYILDKYCRELTFLTTKSIYDRYTLPFEWNLESNLEKQTLSNADRTLMEKKLPAHIASTIIRMWSLCQSSRRNLNEFIEHFDLLVTNAQLPVLKLDRKVERQLLFNLQKENLTKIKAATDKDLLASYVVAFYFQQVTGCALPIPKEEKTSNNQVLKAISDKVPSVIQDILKKLWNESDKEEFCLEEIKEILSNNMKRKEIN